MPAFSPRRPPASSLWVLGFALISLASLIAPALADDSHAVLHTRKGDFTFNIEVVDTEAGRERGLMGRKSLAPDAGMLFDFKTPSPVSMWMKNTFIPLDMVFIDAGGRVINIAERTVPQSLDPVAAAAPARAVLEVNGGTAARLGIKPGDRVLFPIFGNAS